jgi:ElaB/YqjD/DUF883 family membrane-anchored ribosome-binding protein
MSKTETKKIENILENAENAAETLEEKVEHAGEAVRGFFKTTKMRTNNECKNMRKRIVKKPLTSAAIALGTGVLITALLRRR